MNRDKVKRLYRYARKLALRRGTPILGLVAFQPAFNNERLAVELSDGLLVWVSLWTGRLGTEKLGV